MTLYKQKLIYRDKRLVNWDPQFQTAISDLEVEQREVDGQFWHFAYPLEDGSGEIVVATTRPETMLGDTAIAVNPTDERYQALIGRRAVRLPIVGPSRADHRRRLRVDPEKGSGAVEDLAAWPTTSTTSWFGKRHSLPMINIFDDFARVNDNAPAAYRGLDRFSARKKVVEEFENLCLLRGIEKTRHKVPHGDRSGVVVEPYLTDQWFVNAEVLARDAIKAVEEGDTVFVPKHWEKTYFEWMRNIQPWTISRQLWWGHRIPAWFGMPTDGGERLSEFVAETEGEAKAQATASTMAATRYAMDTPGRGRARHLVLLGAVAFLDARLAGEDRRPAAVLSDPHAHHRLRHHLLLGRPDDDAGPAFHG